MENLKEIIKQHITVDGKLACKDAFKIAQKLGVELAIVGKECNSMNIKINGCQLGCF